MNPALRLPDDENLSLVRPTLMDKGMAAFLAVMRNVDQRSGIVGDDLHRVAWRQATHLFLDSQDRQRAQQSERVDFELVRHGG